MQPNAIEVSTTFLHLPLYKLPCLGGFMVPVECRYSLLSNNNNNSREVNDVTYTQLECQSTCA